MTVRKVNKAAMRRERAQLLADKASTPPPLPESFRSWVREDYMPRGERAVEHWPRLKPFVLDILERSAVRDQATLRQHVTHVAGFGAWLIDHGLPLDGSSFVRRNVDEYARVGMPKITAGSRNDRRSRLRNIADRLHPELAPEKVETSRRDALKPPYTANEMVAIWRAATIQPTDLLTQQMCLCVGLGAGAGIDSAELKLLLGRHITDHGDDGIEVTVPGKAGRNVWVLREYEDLIRRGARGIEDDQPLIGIDQTRNNVAARVYGRARIHGATPKPEQSRLRTTWIATLMCRPVPLAVICHAAGLRSTRTLFDLLPHLENGDMRQALRDGGAAR